MGVVKQLEHDLHNLSHHFREAKSVDWAVSIVNLHLHRLGGSGASAGDVRETHRLTPDIQPTFLDVEPQFQLLKVDLLMATRLDQVEGFDAGFEEGGQRDAAGHCAEQLCHAAVAAFSLAVAL